MMQFAACAFEYVSWMEGWPEPLKMPAFVADLVSEMTTRFVFKRRLLYMYRGYDRCNYQYWGS